MAIIQNIRTKYAKLTGGIIVLALVGFIVMDATNGQSSFMALFGNSNSMGKIDGQKISFDQFEDRIKAYQQQVTQQNQGQPLSDDQQAQIRDQVWQQVVSESVINSVDKKLGIDVSNAEVKELTTGVNPDPMIRQMFVNQSGQYDPAVAQQQIAAAQKDPKAKDQWEMFKTELINRRKQEKFNALVTGSVYVPQFVLADQEKAKNTYASISYVQVPYATVPDNSVKVSDDEIKKYMEAHKALFTLKESMRSFDYVVFPIAPSATDTANIMKVLEPSKADLATIADTDMVNFINTHSQSTNPPSYLTADQLKSFPNAAELAAAPAGTIIGPFAIGNTLNIAKVMEKGLYPDSVTIKNIVILSSAQGQTMRSDSAAKLRADSVMSMLRDGKPFDSLVNVYTDDSRGKNNGGEAPVVLAQKGMMSKELGDFIFSQPEKALGVVKESEGGTVDYRIVYIEKRSAPIEASKYAFISQNLDPSSETSNLVFQKASNFLTKAQNGGAQGFEKAAIENRVNKVPVNGVSVNASYLQGLGSVSDIMKWANVAKVGDLSGIISRGNNIYIARLTGVYEKGLLPVNAATRQMVEPIIKKSKKAQAIIKRNEGKKSLELVAQAEKQTISNADSINFLNPMIPTVGSEPKVSGYSFFSGLAQNTMSTGIAGINGVYYISVKQRVTVPGNSNPLMDKQMATYMLKNSGSQFLLNDLIDRANMTDNRAKFYNTNH